MMRGELNNLPIPSLEIVVKKIRIVINIIIIFDIVTEVNLINTEFLGVTLQLTADMIAFCSGISGSVVTRIDT